MIYIKMNKNDSSRKNPDWVTNLVIVTLETLNDNSLRNTIINLETLLFEVCFDHYRPL